MFIKEIVYCNFKELNQFIGTVFIEELKNFCKKLIYRINSVFFFSLIYLIYRFQMKRALEFSHKTTYPVIIIIKYVCHFVSINKMLLSKPRNPNDWYNGDKNFVRILQFNTICLQLYDE